MKIETEQYSLYLGDCLEVMREFDDNSVDAVITDPPYGIDVATNYAERKRTALAQCNNFKPIVGDDKPFDPKPFLKFPVVALFGANYYSEKLPPSGGWIVWDKLDGLVSQREIGFNDNSDCEFIWTNKGNAARIIRHRWMGAMKGSEQTVARVHPTQKPVVLMKKLIKYLTDPGDVVFDPYLGSGTTGVACAQLGRRFIGVEIDPDYFEIARKRIEVAYAQIVMF
jgi:site-specific DNA-methyltransferase (adenine-specific)/modification methylase